MPNFHFLAKSLAGVASISVGFFLLCRVLFDHMKIKARARFFFGGGWLLPSSPLLPYSHFFLAVIPVFTQLFQM